jgi:hypothetical protein
MKRCPRCNQTYTDDGLNFCLNDGEFLLGEENDPPPTIFGEPSSDQAAETPTVFLNRPRVTNQTNWQPAPPPAPWQPGGINVQGSTAAAAFSRSQDQTLPTISLILGIVSVLLICCWGGLPLGAAAFVTGFLGMRNADGDPTRYGGRGLAIGGMVLGIVSFLASLIFLFFGLLAR